MITDDPCSHVGCNIDFKYQTSAGRCPMGCGRRRWTCCRTCGSGRDGSRQYNRRRMRCSRVYSRSCPGIQIIFHIASGMCIDSISAPRAIENRMRVRNRAFSGRSIDSVLAQCVIDNDGCVSNRPFFNSGKRRSRSRHMTSAENRVSRQHNILVVCLRSTRRPTASASNQKKASYKEIYCPAPVHWRD
jgi:hypothetical protein